MENLEHWLIDAGHSSFRFTLRHLVIHEIQGGFSRWGGDLIFDRTEPYLSRVLVWVDLASIDTGDAERDAQVRSPEFLDVQRFPRAEFRSTHVSVRDHEPAVVSGRLTLHGVAHDVQLTIESQRNSTDADGRIRAVYTITGKVDRQAFGLRWNQDLDAGGVVVGDDVRLQVEAALVRAPARAASPDKHAPDFDADAGVGPAASGR